MARKVSYKQAFISRLLGNSTNWPREMKVMNTLVESYPEEIFWSGVVVKFRIPSLAWFLTENGKKFLKDEWNKFKYTPQEIRKFEIEEVENIDGNPIIEKAPRKEKIKTVGEFLKIWGSTKN